MSDQENAVFEDEEVVDQTEEVDDTVEDDEPTPIEVAFDEAMSEDKSEDEIMLDMIAAGATFKNVKTIFNACMVSGGYANSKTEKAEIVNDTLSGMDLSTEEGFAAAVEALTDNLKGVNDKSAAGSIRQYAKKNELEVFKKPKGTGAGRSGITSAFHDYLRANSPVSKEDVAGWIEANGTDNTKRHASHYQGLAALCADIANS